MPVSDQIPASLTSGRANGPTLAARAHKAKPDTPQPVTAELGDVGADADGDDAARMEQERLSRLRRWQAER